MFFAAPHPLVSGPGVGHFNLCNERPKLTAAESLW